MNRTSRQTTIRGGLVALAAGVALLGFGTAAMAEGMAIELDSELSMTGVIEELDDGYLMMNDRGFVLLPTTRVYNRDGRELEAFHLHEGHHVEIHYDPRHEPSVILDVTLLRRGG